MGVNYSKRNTSLELELQRTREDLEGLERYIKEFSEFLPLPFCIVNPLNVITGINQSFQDLTGYNEIEIVGSEITPLFLEKKEAAVLTEEILKKDIRIIKEMTLLTEDKREIPISVSGLARKDEEGNLIGYFLAFSDISEVKEFQRELEKRAREETEELGRKVEESENFRKALVNILEDIEQALRRAEEEKNKTLAIITNFADGLLVFDEKNKLSLVNPQAEVFFDIKTRDLIGKSILELSVFPIFKKLIKLVGPEIKGVFREEFHIKESLALEVSTVSAMRKKEKLGTLIILHDITREKMIERMKTEFVSLAAHQLRTPLSAIKWTLQMLLDGDFGRINPEQRNFIEKTYQSNERMITLINDLLDITRIEEGRYLYKPTLDDIETITQFVIESYKDEIEKRKLKINFKKSEKKLPKVMIDVEKMRIAIQNILDNAIKYTPIGGEVIISLKYIEKEIEVKIQDSGVGIPKDQQERIFTKFFRGANIIKMKTEGSGLGLFIAKNIIEVHGGKIWFESEKDKGTTFYFTLPVEKEFE